MHSGIILCFLFFGAAFSTPVSKSRSLHFEDSPEDADDPLSIDKKDFKIHIPGEPLSPEEFRKAEKRPIKRGSIEPNDPTNEDIIEIKQVNKVVRQKDSPVEPWEKGVIPYVLDSDFDEDQRLDLAKAIQEFEQDTCIRFVAADLEKDEDYVFFESTDEGCKSPIGYKGGRQTIRLADNCFDQFGRLLHEMLHTVGFIHEQARTDRDKFVHVDYDVIKEGLHRFYVEKYEHNFEKRDPPAGNYAGEYDTKSIMHYSASAFADPKSEITIFPYFDETENLGQREGFTKMDMDKANKYYKCKKEKPAATKQRLTRLVDHICTKGTTCSDLHPNCEKLAKQNLCNTKEDWMAVNCRHTCDKCDTECKDVTLKCSTWASAGYCTQYEEFMIPYCPRSCKAMVRSLDRF